MQSASDGQITVVTVTRAKCRVAGHKNIIVAVI